MSKTIRRPRKDLLLKGKGFLRTWGQIHEDREDAPMKRAMLLCLVEVEGGRGDFAGDVEVKFRGRPIKLPVAMDANTILTSSIPPVWGTKEGGVAVTHSQEWVDIMEEQRLCARALWEDKSPEAVERNKEATERVREALRTSGRMEHFSAFDTGWLVDRIGEALGPEALYRLCGLSSAQRERLEIIIQIAAEMAIDDLPKSWFETATEEEKAEALAKTRERIRARLF